jgi:hypothetical protein
MQWPRNTAEAFEDPSLVFWRDANASIDYADLCSGPIHLLGSGTECECHRLANPVPQILPALLI